MDSLSPGKKGGKKFLGVSIPNDSCVGLLAHGFRIFHISRQAGPAEKGRILFDISHTGSL